MSFVQGKLGITVQSALLDGERYHQYQRPDPLSRVNLCQDLPVPTSRYKLTKYKRQELLAKANMIWVYSCESH
jgi:hypothetical protein